MKCEICEKDIESQAYVGKIYIIQEDSTTMGGFKTMYFHISCYILKHYPKVSK